MPMKHLKKKLITVLLYRKTHTTYLAVPFELTVSSI